MMRFYQFVAFLLLVVATTGCSTKKNTWTHRTYHSVTSYYNIYFNGKEAYKKGVLQIENAYRDDFTKIIPIYKFGGQEASQAGYGEMDRAIKKSSKLIKQHSIKVKPKAPKKAMSKKEKEFYKKNEYNKWVDDSYLLIGKAYFYQMELNKAARSFQVVLRKFPKTDIEKVANLWLWRTYNESGEFIQAEQYMNLCLKEPLLKSDYAFELAAFEAEFYLRQKQYENANSPLRDALRKTKKKQKRLRIEYIIAQTYLLQGEYRKASKHFSHIAKKSHDYSMAFNARIQQALAYDEGVGNYEELVKGLEKLTKDEKNADFQDRIYLAIATVAKKAGKEEDAIEYYHKTLQAQGDDPNVKAEAYLALADVSFEKKQYEVAGAYYDSTMTNLSKKHSNYDEISVKAKNLTSLGQSLKSVDREDSLQRMARMDEGERNDLIDRTIAEVKRLEAEAKRNDMPDNNRYDPSNSVSNNNTSGGWYFYNPSAMGFGESEFKRKWGERRLADHWRRKNKTVLEEAEALTENDEKGDKEPSVNDPKKREYYMQNLPKTDEEFATSDKKIQEEMLKVGNIYKNELNDHIEASKAYEALAKRFPKSDYALEAYYNLYLMNLHAGKNTMAEKYKQIILRDFPDSSKAKALGDPDYANRLKNARKLSENNYRKAFDLYNAEQPDQALAVINQSLKDFPKNHLEDRFTLLKAMCYGKKQNLEDYKRGLSLVISKYPDSPAKPLAQKMLDVAEKGKVGGVRLNEDIYKTAPGNSHLVIFHPANGSSENRLKFLLTSIGADFSATLDIEIKSNETSDGIKLISSGNFSDAIEAQKFLDFLLEKDEFKAEEKSINAQLLISDENLKTLIKDGDLEKYKGFFNENY